MTTMGDKPELNNNLRKKIKHTFYKNELKVKEELESYKLEYCKSDHCLKMEEHLVTEF